MTGFIEIIIWPTHVTGIGQRYRVEHDGYVLLESTPDPFYNSARALLDVGVDPDDVMVMVDGPCSMPSLHTRIGWAALYTVSETAAHGPQRVKWSPYSGPPRKDSDEENPDE